VANESFLALSCLPVLDVNDNSPVFEDNLVKANVSRSVRTGMLVARVSANDPDEGLNGEVAYRYLIDQRAFEACTRTIFNSAAVTAFAARLRNRTFPQKFSIANKTRSKSLFALKPTANGALFFPQQHLTL